MVLGLRNLLIYGLKGGKGSKCPQALPSMMLMGEADVWDTGLLKSTYALAQENMRT